MGTLLVTDYPKCSFLQAIVKIKASRIFLAGAKKVISVYKPAFWVQMR